MKPTRSNRDELKEYYGDHNDEIQMPMDFMFCEVNKLSANDFRKQIANAESTGGWPVYVISNHDMPRSYDRYGDGKHNDADREIDGWDVSNACAARPSCTTAKSWGWRTMTQCARKT